MPAWCIKKQSFDSWIHIWYQYIFININLFLYLKWNVQNNPMCIEVVVMVCKTTWKWVFCTAVRTVVQRVAAFLLDHRRVPGAGVLSVWSARIWTVFHSSSWTLLLVTILISSKVAIWEVQWVGPLPPPYQDRRKDKKPGGGSLLNEKVLFLFLPKEEIAYVPPCPPVPPPPPYLLHEKNHNFIASAHCAGSLG